MKLLNILGAVVAAHVAVLVLAVAIPGCRSTRTTAPAAGAEGPSPAISSAPARSGTPAFTAAPELSDRDLNPGVAAEPLAFDPDAPARASGGAGRFSPTRPDSTVATAMDRRAIDPVPVTPATTYTVKRGDNLWTLARRNGITVRELAAANNIPADAMLRENQVLVIPAAQAASTASAAAPAATAAGDSSGRTYTIKSGDTLSRIASRHGVTVAQLKAYNRLTSDMVRAGDTLSIPDSAAEPVSETVAATPPPAATTPASTAGAYKHVVAPGDRLSLIASRYGVTVGELAVANKISDPSLIRPGQEIIIPGWKATDTPPAGPSSRATTATAARTPTTPAATPTTTEPPADDLDAGLDTTLDNVPVIDVERAPSPAEDEEPIPTISIGGGGGGGGDGDSPPLFE